MAGISKDVTKDVTMERVQLGVRMEKRMVKILKGLAEYNGETLGQLLEKIVMHSFEAVPGGEGEMAVSAHSKRELEVVADLERIYGLDYGAHGNRRFWEPEAVAESEPWDLET